jgi:hypothetical protein
MADYTGKTQKSEGGSVLLKSTVDIDFASTLNGAASAVKTVTVTGARKGDVVFVREQGTGAPTFGRTYHGLVSADDTVSVWFHNSTGGTVDLASTTFEIFVLSANKLTV